MTPTSIFKRARGGREQIDIQEAYNIWNLLKARYLSAQTVQLFSNFVHDRDLSIVLNTLLTHFKQQIDILEKEGRKFKITLPTRPPLDIKFSTSINDITDEYIYHKIIADMMAQLFSLTHALRSTTTNDTLRVHVINDLTGHIKDFEMLYKYGKMKGWEEPPPAYKTATPVMREQLSTAEAFHIWDHIAQRYDQLELTAFFHGFAHDLDFRAILLAGQTILNKQVSMLEQYALNFEVTLPKRPAASVKSPIDPETMTDKMMFSYIFNGIIGSVDLHIKAIIETIKNDALRQIWLNLFKEELQMYDKYVKYGKMKGWTKVVPIYGEPV
ncbi:MAG: DUF3231 family protein [Dethiobacter sp.]|jgi:hypothetical protein|nr:DUF3231 family protein [Dethiobacter sp.]